MSLSRVDKNYGVLLGESKQRVYRAQYDALKVVNKELITLYWDIGKMIAVRQKKYGVRGFSSRNIGHMRNFSAFYSRNAKPQPLVAEISWPHNIVIMEKCKDALEREFYMHMTRRAGWTKNVLIHQIDGRAYQKTLGNQTNFRKTLPAGIRNQAKLAVKDEYSFDFLELGEEHDEYELERALIKRVNRFLTEMGGVFTFMGNQFRKEFFIDILLYHRRLKCLVAVGLKAGEFKPEYAEKMQFYLSALDDRVKVKGENPSIGIILCKDKDRTIVEYERQQSRKSVGAAIYKVISRLPEKYRKELPSPKQAEMLVRGLSQRTLRPLAVKRLSKRETNGRRMPPPLAGSRPEAGRDE
jgi:predicted nuclease of restriction endonuclease-like (RecB) superfamily